MNRQDEIDMLQGRMGRLAREIDKVQEEMRLRLDGVRRVMDWQAVFAERLQAHSAIVNFHTQGLALCDLLGTYSQAWDRYTELCGEQSNETAA
jgi:hypothetical protein